MAQPVKRKYSSELRATQARETQRAIVDAGAKLFVEQGFGRTTVDEIAAAAGVSRKTVFASVGGKAEIIKLAIDWAIGGDDEPVALVQRPIIQQAMGQTDPDQIIRTWASIACQISRRLSKLSWALISAAGTDPQAQVVLEDNQAQRLAGARLFVNHLAAQGGLRAGVSIDEAVDTVWAYNDPILFYRLVEQRRWSVKRYEDWLYRTVQWHLGADPPARKSRRT